ncbi:MAG TPA: polysaccharide biosynthesis/export family protein [Methylomirabilota bacterium]|nr:polysaccharide biosynthesis/export family protein [Methylomirabilota bacterium]
MKRFELCLRAALGLFSLTLLLFGSAGCVSDRADPNPDSAFRFPGQSAPVGPATPGAPGSGPALSEGVVLSPGELVTITFSDLPHPFSVAMPERRERIREDGTITLPFNVTVKAAGRSPVEVERDIHAQYVPKLFTQITVTIRPEERFYFVGGQVKVPNRYPYGGRMTVLRAIDTAQGFTDFANKRKVELRRVNGERIMVDWHKAVKDPRFDPPVYPDDQIIVHRKIW